MKQLIKFTLSNYLITTVEVATDAVSTFTESTTTLVVSTANVSTVVASPVEELQDTNRTVASKIMNCFISVLFYLFMVNIIINIWEG